MGFYNFYKILKDMFRTVFGNKFLKILFVIIIIFIVITIKNACFAISEINTITVDNLTFNFASGWNADNSSYTGDMSNMTILRYTLTGSNVYYYFYVRTSYPVSITRTNYSNYSTHTIQSLNNGSPTVFAYQSSTTSNAVTSFSVGNPSRASSYNISNQYVNYDLNNVEILYSNLDVYLDNEPIYQNFVAPSLSNTQTQLENLSFSNFIINANSFTDDLKNNDGLLYMLFYNRSLSNPQTTEGLYPIKEKIFVDGSIYIDYENSTEDNLIFSYPIFKTGVMFNVGSTYEIKFAKVTGWYDNDTPLLEYFDNSYTFTISRDVTQDYINELNQQTATTSDEDNNKELQDKIDNQTNAINNQTQSIDNINNSITDSTVDNSSIDLPTDNTADPTQSGVDNIFQTIYNSFTSGTAQDIVLPIPFTNKSITIEANYLYNALQNNNANWIINIIQAFYWYIISRFIIKDIMGKIRKIKQGNFENIQNSNIKEDML